MAKDSYSFKYFTIERNLPNAIIVDLDGVMLFDNTPLPKDNTREAWDEWHKKAFISQKPNQKLFKLLNSLKKITTIFLTSRECIPDVELFYRTLDILSINMSKDFILLNRPYNDYNKCIETKKNIYYSAIHGRYDILFAIDDREDICNMWNELGIPTMKYTHVGDDYVKVGVE